MQKSTRKKMVRGLAIFAALIVIFNVCRLDYNDLSFTHNSGAYLGIISNLIVSTLAWRVSDRKLPHLKSIRNESDI